VLVLWNAGLAANGTRTVSVSPALSDANTVAASDIYKLSALVQLSDLFKSGTHHYFTGLTPGSTTFTLQYKVSAGTATINNRELTVIPIGD